MFSLVLMLDIWSAVNQLSKEPMAPLASIVAMEVVIPNALVWAVPTKNLAAWEMAGFAAAVMMLAAERSRFCLSRVSGSSLMVFSNFVLKRWSRMSLFRARRL